MMGQRSWSYRQRHRSLPAHQSLIRIALLKPPAGCWHKSRPPTHRPRTPGTDGDVDHACSDREYRSDSHAHARAISGRRDECCLARGIADRRSRPRCSFRPRQRRHGRRPPPTPRPPTAIPSPTPIPVDLLRGNIRWTAARSPIRLLRDQRLVAGATLIIEPGVEVRLAPGVSFFVEGTLYALGTADRPIRFVANERQRWEGLFGRPGSNIALEYTELRGGGAGGTLLTSESGNLVLHHARINDNGGHIQVSDSRLEMRDSEIAGNDMPYGAALDASYLGGGIVIMTNNRIGGNRQQAGSPPVSLSNLNAFETLNLDLQGNLLVGNNAPDLVLFTNGPLQGGLTCNALIAGTNGLSIRSEAPQVPGDGAECAR